MIFYMKYEETSGNTFTLKSLWLLLIFLSLFLLSGLQRWSVPSEEEILCGSGHELQVVSFITSDCFQHSSVLKEHDNIWGWWSTDFEVLRVLCCLATLDPTTVIRMLQLLYEMKVIPSCSNHVAASFPAGSQSLVLSTRRRRWGRGGWCSESWPNCTRLTPAESTWRTCRCSANTAATERTTSPSWRTSRSSSEVQTAQLPVTSLSHLTNPVTTKAFCVCSFTSSCHITVGGASRRHCWGCGSDYFLKSSHWTSHRVRGLIKIQTVNPYSDM